jgi:ribosomal protein S6--L-glutamate ligase
MKPKKCILLNANRDTTKAFAEHFGQKIPLESYRTKEILMHLHPTHNVSFLSGSKPISFADAYVFLRMRGNDTHFCGMITEFLYHNSIETNDPVHAIYKNSASKITQMLMLTLASIRIPETIIFREESFRTERAYIESWAKFPLVYKTGGRRGEHVHLVKSFSELETRVREKKPYRLALIQPFIPNTFDTRTLVAYGEVLGTIKRTRTNGYLNNISQGAIASAYTLSDEEKQVTINAAAVCRIDFAGVDIIHTDTGPVVLEVNKSPQVRGFNSVYKGNVLKDVARIIEEKFFDA